MLGFALIRILNVVITWGFFFPYKRMEKLRVKVSTEVIGRDTIMNAASKGIGELTTVIEKIDKDFPKPIKRGC